MLVVKLWSYDSDTTTISVHLAYKVVLDEIEAPATALLVYEES